MEDTGGRAGPTDRVAEVVATVCGAFLHGDAVGSREVAVSRCAGGHYAGVVHASGETARSLEALQEGLGVGPGPTALLERGPVLVDVLGDDPRSAAWVGFLQPAAALGVVSVHAFPLQVGATAVGLLTVHSGRPAVLGPADLPRAFRLTDLVMTALLDPVLVAGSTAGAQLPELLDSHHVVTHQAVGMVSVQTESSVADAFALLQANAFATGTPLVELAQQVVARKVSFRDIGARTDRRDDVPGHGGEGDGGRR